MEIEAGFLCGRRHSATSHNNFPGIKIVEGNLTMKRNMDLIRLLLLDTEGESPKPDLSSYSEEKIVYHSALIIEAGLVHGEITSLHGEPRLTSRIRLTWSGHEFLDAARDASIWHKASERVKKSGVDVTFTLLSELLKQLLKQHLGLP
jgi:hypothetical protein